jgi:hypothetical protein
VANGKLAIEPTILEDQKKRYLDHLNELRRLNEGDDSADAPGYALNLVSIPISVLPGDCTQTGYGAECTVTASPHLTEDLLPRTFRDLVINDLVDLLGLQVTQNVEVLLDKGHAKETKKLWAIVDQYDVMVAKRETAKVRRGVAAPQNQAAEATDPNEVKAKADQKAAAAELIKALPPVAVRRTAGLSLRPGKRRPLAPSEVDFVVGGNRLRAIALGLFDQIADNHVACQKKLYYLDVQAALQREMRTAYDLLATERCRGLWNACSHDLAEAIRSQDDVKLREIRRTFVADLAALTDDPAPYSPDAPVVFPDNAITKALAWAIIVDSALLTRQFLDDMKETATAKGCSCAPAGWPPLYLPHPPAEVCQQFNEYVRCRWPLRVFALDPETQDQNVADSYRLRREMQFALSAAFAGGNIGARTFTRYTRRIEQDIDTIAINHTQVGFSHGDDTFGWRFYPRVQTPPINGNLEAIFGDLIVGGRGPGYYLRRRQLENGIRNCVALVIMPSFVPYLDFEVTANWFRLDHPKCKELTLKQTLRLSEEVQTLRQYPADAGDCYRPGDTALVMARLEQLSKRLPLQHQLVNVPYENTHGGFELLSAGVTVLAPELYGWYGAPGINPNGDTTLILVGDNFNVHQTRVIVGGRALDAVCTMKCPDTTPPAAMTCQGPVADPAAAVAVPVAAPVVPVPVKTCASCERDAEVVQAARRCAVAAPAPNVTITQAAPPAMPITITASPTISPTVSPTISPTVSPTITPTVSPTITVTGPPAAAVTAAAVVANAAGCSGPTGSIYQVELLSRQVVRVIIPKGVYFKDGLVDVHIATPYGVSPALQIPVLGATAAKAAKAEGYSIDPAKLTFKYLKVGLGKGAYALAPAGLVPGSASVDVKWNDALGTAPGHIRLSFEFEYGKNTFELPLPGPFAGKDGKYTVPANHLDALIRGYLLTVNRFGGPFTEETNPLASGTVKTKSIKVTPIEPGRDVAPITVPTQLEITFQGSVAAAPAPVVPAPLEVLPAPAPVMPPPPEMPPAAGDTLPPPTAAPATLHGKPADASPPVLPDSKEPSH